MNFRSAQLSDGGTQLAARYLDREVSFAPIPRSPGGIVATAIASRKAKNQ